MNAAGHYVIAEQMLNCLPESGPTLLMMDGGDIAMIALTHAVLAVAAEMGVPTSTPATAKGTPVIAVTDQAGQDTGQSIIGDWVGP